MKDKEKKERIDIYGGHRGRITYTVGEKIPNIDNAQKAPTEKVKQISYTKDGSLAVSIFLDNREIIGYFGMPFVVHVPNERG